MSGSSQNPGDSFVKNLAERLGAEGPASAAQVASAATVPPPPPRPSGRPSGAPLPPMDHPPGGFDDFEPTVAEGGSNVRALHPVLSEEELENEPTRMDSSQLIPEEATAILDTRPDPPTVSVLSGKDQGKTFVLQEGENGIGRSIDNDVILTDISVSRRHLTLVRRDGEVRLVDLGSGNGTQVNGRRTSGQVLNPGDQVALGETVLVLAIPTGSSALRKGASAFGGAAAPAGFAPPPPFDPSAIPQGLNAPPPPAAPYGSAPLGGQLVGGAPPPGLGRSLPTDQMALPQEPKGPRRLLLPALALGGILILAVAAAVTAALVGGDEEVPNEASLSDTFNSGHSALREGRYAEAERFFQEVLLARPDDQAAEAQLARAVSAREDEQAVVRAQNAIESERFAEALLALDSVGEGSPLLEQATPLRNRAQQGRVGALTALADRKLAAGDTIGARQAYTDARALDGNDARVVELAARLAEGGEIENPRGTQVAQRGPDSVRAPPTTGPTVRPPRPVATPLPMPRPTMTPVATMDEPTGASSDARSQALRAYRSRDFAGAAQIARQGARRVRGADREALNSLASAIDSFAPAYAAATAPGATIQTIRRAKSADARAGRGFANELNGRLADLHVAAAREASGINRCGQVRSALVAAPRHPQAQSMLPECVALAQGLLDQAQNASRSSAQGLLGRVRTILPSSHPLSRQATQQLNRLRGGGDEDEG